MSLYIPKRAIYCFAFLMICLIHLFAIAPDARAEKIGVIMSRGSEFSQKSHAALLSYLKEKGYGTRIQFLSQTPNPDPVAWSNASRKIMAADVDAILVYGTAPTVATIKEKPDVPVIYVGIYQPIAEKLHSRNVTGVCSKPGIGNLIRYMHDSGTTNPAVVLYSSAEDDSREQFREFMNLAGKYRISMAGLDIRKPADFSSVMADVTGGTIFITSSLVIESVLHSVLRTAYSRKIPTASLMPSENPSPILSISPTADRIGQETARKIIALLEGARPGNIPVTCVQDTEVVYNLRDAQTMNIKVPLSILNDATRIVK